MKKLIAGFLTALTALMSIASPALAASELGDYPTYMTSPIVVVGSDADTADVVGAVDVAVRLVEVGEELTSVSCPGAGVAAAGIDKDGISANNAALSTGGSVYDVAFPTTTLKTFHYSGLDDSYVTWRTVNYDYHEEALVGGVRMRHTTEITGVNGTEKMEIQSGDVIYRYVFDKALTGTGSISTPNYTYPITISMMDNDFQIVGTGSNQVKMLKGSIGTADATTPVEYGGYKFYAPVGSTNTLQIKVTDENDNQIETLLFTGITSGTAATKTTTGTDPIIDVMVTAFGTLQDGTVLGADLVVGPTGTVTKTYDDTADTTSTGTANDAFPGETLWGIRIQSGKFGGTAGTITAADGIEVVYQPTVTQYLGAGEKLVLPNDYAELGFVGFGTDTFVTISIDPFGPTSVYNSTGNVVGSELYGLKLESDVAGSIVGDGGNGYDKMYILVAKETGAAETAQPYPVYVAFWDKSNQRISIGDIAAGTNASAAVTEASYSTDGIWYYTNTTFSISYDFKLSYGGAGELSYWLNTTIDPGNKEIFTEFDAGQTGNLGVNMTSLQNKTDWTTSAAPSFRFGGTTSKAESDDITSKQEGSSRSVGQYSQDIVDDSGVIVKAPATHGAGDRVKLKVPSKELTVRVYFGKESGEVAAADTVEYTTYPAIPMTSAVAKLDTEVVASTSLQGRNMVSVGGPCVNRVTAEALGMSYPSCGAAAASALGISSGEALIKAVDDVYTTGKVIVVVAGYEADQTRTASTVLQQFDTLLTGQGSAVIVTAATSAGITPA